MKGTVIIRDNDSWLLFSRPIAVVQAFHTSEVLPAIEKITDYSTNSGCYTAGFISYDASPAFDSALKVRESGGFPLLWFGIYGEPDKQPVLPEPGQYPRYSIGTWEPDMPRNRYDADISTIKKLIADGHTYQVNYTFRMRSNFTGNSFAFFRDMMQGNSAPYCSFIHTGRFAICSASPELFFSLDGKSITCRPMKGTVKRGLTTAEDLKLSSWLQSSEKNRAENIMITDMIRNDLGRIARTGSVHVPSLFDTERYQGLWQMTSTVCAETCCGLAEILKALFPCASITGAPKVRTMEIIRDLESSPRGLYTGCAGYTAPGQKMRFSVVIRTVTIDHENGLAEYGTGGGILIDSTCSGEYDEALLKAASVTRKNGEFSLFETILHKTENGFALLERHMLRMEDSADYFGFAFSREQAISALEAAAGQYDRADLRIKLLLDRHGRFEVEVNTPLQNKTLNNHQYLAHIAAAPVSSQNVFLYHKTTERTVYSNAMTRFPEYDDVLLYNELGQITEFTIGNFAARINGLLVTPPVSCGLLAGTYRAELIESGLLAERTILLDELDQCDEIYMINSVRGMQRARIIFT